MAHFLLFQFVIVAGIAFYFMVVRPVMVGSAEENITITSGSLGEKLFARIKGWRTIIMARLVQFGWGAVTVYDGVAKMFPYYLDWTPITDRVFHTIPADMRMFALGMFGIMCGSVMEWLRRITTGPVGRAATQVADDEDLDEVPYDDLMDTIEPIPATRAVAPDALIVPEAPMVPEVPVAPVAATEAASVAASPSPPVERGG